MTVHLTLTERRAIEARAARLPREAADRLVNQAFDCPSRARRRGWTLPPVDTRPEVAA